MVWARYGFAARVRGTTGRGGMSILLYLNGAGEIMRVHGNIGQGNHELVAKQMGVFHEQYNESEGISAGYLLVIDNAK